MNSAFRNALAASLVFGLLACAPARNAAPASTAPVSTASASTVAPASSLPAALLPPTGQTQFLKAAAVGVQIYACKAKADNSGFEWAFKAPEATLTSGGTIIKHYGGPTWEAPDGSKVIAEVKGRFSSDPSAIPWLLLAAKSTSGTGILTNATFIQRLETTGGLAPTSGCDASKLEAEARVPYTSDYAFFSNTPSK